MTGRPEQSKPRLNDHKGSASVSKIGKWEWKEDPEEVELQIRKSRKKLQADSEEMHQE